MSDTITDLMNQLANTAADGLSESGGFAEALFKIVGVEDNPIFQLAQAVKDGDLTPEDFETEMEREKEVLQAQLVTLEIMALSEVQKAINSFVSGLTGALKASL